MYHNSLRVKRDFLRADDVSLIPHAKSTATESFSAFFLDRLRRGKQRSKMRKRRTRTWVILGRGFFFARKRANRALASEPFRLVSSLIRKRFQTTTPPPPSRIHPRDLARINACQLISRPFRNPRAISCERGKLEHTFSDRALLPLLHNRRSNYYPHQSVERYRNL